MPSVIHPLPRITYGSLEQLQEQRTVALFTSGPAWDAVGAALRLNIAWQAAPDDADLSRFSSYAAQIPATVEVIYAVGGGLAVDAAKFAAQTTSLPLIAIPTALSVDAHLTPASGIRRDGCVSYVETAAPAELYVDLDVIAASPAWVRAAGICDLLSIATALWDWRFAESSSRNSLHQHWLPYAADCAQVILDESLRVAESAGRGEFAGLVRLLELLALEVQLCNLIGHSRPEEGSEHAFAYSIENLAGKGLPHGDLVGPGIVAIAAAQAQPVEPLRDALLAAGCRLDRLQPDHGLTTLTNLPDYATQHDLPYGISHVLDDHHVQRAYQAVWG